MEKLKKIVHFLPKPIKNKYSISICLFLIWAIFLDDYNLIKQKKIKNKVNDLKKQKEYYSNEIKKDSTELIRLKNDPDTQEKFAREKFLMKKNNEDIYVIIRD